MEHATASPRNKITLTARAVFSLALLMQASLLLPLWGHTSTSTAFLGRYSTRYGAALILSGVVTLGWLGLSIFARRAANLIQRLPETVILTGIGLSGAGLIVLWQFSLETTILNYLAVNWLAGVSVLTLTRPDRMIAFQRWPFLLFTLALLLLIPLGITTITFNRFSPDESHWADMASTYFMEGGAYSRTWLDRPILIKPGLPWLVAAYGWLLTHVDFAIHTGRIWNFTAYLLAFTGIGLVANHLYGRRAALLSVSIAILSQSIIRGLSYRPDHQLVAVGPLLVWVALKARAAPSTTRGLIWHAAVGLLATLSLNVHAAGIVFAAGFALYYVGEFVTGGWRKGRAGWQPVIAFGVGALVGTAAYYLFNIHSIGGLDVYLAELVSDRWTTRRGLLRILSLPILERLIVLASAVYLLWRRNPADRRILGMLACILIGTLLFDTQGYRSPFVGLLFVPTGSFLMDAFASTNRGSLRSALISGSVIVILLAPMLGGFIRWDAVTRWLQTGNAAPTLYDELRPVLAPYVTDDDVILSVVSLIWTFPEHPHLVNFGAETSGQARLSVDSPLAVWEAVQPTVVIYIQHEMVMTDAMQTYMDQHDFGECLASTVQGRAVTVYRQECPAS